MRTILILAGIIFLALALTVGGLFGLGILHLPDKTAQAEPVKAAPKRELQAGERWLIVAPRKIPAYTRMSIEALFDPRTGVFVRVPAPEASMPANTIWEPGDLVGRVLRFDKLPITAFTEDDFFPPNTREGLVAAIPPGKRAINLGADSIRGIRDLKMGDHLDLLATIPVEMSKINPTGKKIGMDYSGAPSTNLDPGRQATMKLLVNNATLIRTAMPRSPAAAAAAAADKPVQEDVVVAVDPTEVSALIEALSLDAEILCLPRSGQPGDDKTATIPLPQGPKPTVSSIEQITGGGRKTVLVPQAHPEEGDAAK